MAWLDRYIQAEFRGISFFEERSNLSGGRRRPEHVYPGRDGAHYEDLGLKEKEYTVTGYVLGEDYDRERDRLTKAFDRKQAGVLRHPNFGHRLAFVLSYEWTENSDEGGMARFTARFRLGGTVRAPLATSNATDAAKAASAGVTDAVGDRAIAELQLEGPQSLRDRVASATQSLGRTIRRLDVFSGPIRNVQAIESSVRGLIDDAAELATDPVQLVRSIEGAINGIIDSAENAVASLSAYETLYNQFFPERVRSSGTGIPAAINSNAVLLERTVKGAALGGWAVAGTTYPWESQQDAIARPRRGPRLSG